MIHKINLTLLTITLTSNRNGRYNITVNSDLSLFFDVTTSSNLFLKQVTRAEYQDIKFVLTINDDSSREYSIETLIDTSSFPTTIRNFFWF